MNDIYCEKCKERKANFFYEENRNGKVVTLKLCSHCAEKMGLGLEAEESFFPSFPLFFDHKKGKSEKACPNCGTTLQMIQKGGKFGCSVCFDTFAPSLDLTPFIGAGYREEKEIKETKEEEIKKEETEEKTLSSLKNALKEAVLREEYEKAAALRDEIRAKEGK